MRKSILQFFLLFIGLTPIFGQQVAALNVGDMVPNQRLSIIVNGVKGNVNIGDFKDQLLIIDFWNTACGTCLEAMPRMDSLQKQFGAKVKILPVTFEKAGSIIEFWKNNKYTKSLELPSVVEDMELSKMFPHRSVPHEIWVNKGKVIAITDGDYVDNHNIAKVLSGAPFQLPVKYDFYTLDQRVPIFRIDSNQVDVSNTLVEYAAISDFKKDADGEGGGAGSGTIRKDHTIRYFFVNQDIFTSYMRLWLGIYGIYDLIKPNAGIQPNQIIWEVADRSRYKYEKQLGYRRDWTIKNSICFESVKKDTGQVDSSVCRSVINDLDRLLGLNVRWEKKIENVYVLKRNKAVKVLFALNSSDREAYTINYAVYLMNEQERNPYIFDETGLEDGKITLVNAKWNNIFEMKKAFASKGLILEEQQRSVHHLVFSEVDGSYLVNPEMQAEAKVRRIASDSIRIPDPTEGADFLKNNSKKQGVHQTTSGLQYVIKRNGTGRKPTENDKVLVNYEAKLINNKIFDSTYEKGKPEVLSVGGGMIPGWTEALKLMPEGSKWDIYIPSRIAYGSHTAGGQIPRNSDLIFSIDLLKIIK